MALEVKCSSCRVTRGVRGLGEVPPALSPCPHWQWSQETEEALGSQGPGAGRHTRLDQRPQNWWGLVLISFNLHCPPPLFFREVLGQGDVNKHICISFPRTLSNVLNILGFFLMPDDLFMERKFLFKQQIILTFGCHLNVRLSPTPHMWILEVTNISTIL